MPGAESSADSTVPGRASLCASGGLWQRQGTALAHVPRTVAPGILETSSTASAACYDPRICNCRSRNATVASVRAWPQTLRGTVLQVRRKWLFEASVGMMCPCCCFPLRESCHGPPCMQCMVVQNQWWHTCVASTGVPSRSLPPSPHLAMAPIQSCGSLDQCFLESIILQGFRM